MPEWMGFQLDATACHCTPRHTTAQPAMPCRATPAAGAGPNAQSFSVCEEACAQQWNDKKSAAKCESDSHRFRTIQTNITSFYLTCNVCMYVTMCVPVEFYNSILRHLPSTD
ncbi:hypothetical protein B5X24_HaOG212036 [Helicoverpa armigera]|nr:hypothetical protein B5X24_HaOG212036 [Helicoverpa armigera]